MLNSQLKRAAAWICAAAMTLGQWSVPVYADDTGQEDPASVEFIGAENVSNLLPGRNVDVLAGMTALAGDKALDISITGLEAMDKDGASIEAHIENGLLLNPVEGDHYTVAYEAGGVGVMRQFDVADMYMSGQYISGEEDILVVVGESVDLLAGATASDSMDNDYSVSVAGVYPEGSSLPSTRSMVGMLFGAAAALSFKAEAKGLWTVEYVAVDSDGKVVGVKRRNLRADTNVSDKQPDGEEVPQNEPAPKKLMAAPRLNAPKFGAGTKGPIIEPGPNFKTDITGLVGNLNKIKNIAIVTAKPANSINVGAFHVHSGDETNGGACYEYKDVPVEERCTCPGGFDTGWYYGDSDNPIGAYCEGCGHAPHTGQCTYVESATTGKKWVLSCGKTPGVDRDYKIWAGFDAATGTLNLYPEGGSNIWFSPDCSTMFDGMTSLKSLDLSTFRGDDMTSTKTMFPSSLMSLKLPATFKFSNDTGTTETIGSGLLEYWTADDADTEEYPTQIQYNTSMFDGTFEGMFNKNRATWSQYTWVRDNDHHSYIARGQAATTPGGNIWEVHNPDNKFYGYCFAQHLAGPNGKYDKVCCDDINVLLQILNKQHYRNEPAGNDVREALITMLYYGFPYNAGGIQEKYGLTDQQYASITWYALRYYSDSLAYLGGATGELINMKYSSIPASVRNNLHLYVYVSEQHQQHIVAIEGVGPAIGGVSVIKEENSTGRPLENAVFTIYNADGTPAKSLEGTPLVMKSGADGKAFICRCDRYSGLVPGKYIVRETTPPSGYKKCDYEYTFEVKRNGQIVKTGINSKTGNREIMTFRNDPIVPRRAGGVRMRKVDTANTSLGLQGAHYGVYKTDGTKVTDLYTDTDGYAETGKQTLDLGNYYIQEIEAPAGYRLSNEKISFSVTAENAIQANVLIAKDPAKTGSTKLVVHKRVIGPDKNKTYHFGAGEFEFKLYQVEFSDDASGKTSKRTLVATTTNKADGTIEFGPFTYSYASSIGTGHVNYIITETPKNDGRYQYDTHEEMLEVAFRDLGGQDLTIEVMPGGDIKDHTDPDYLAGYFTNKVIAPKTIPAPVKEVSKGTAIEEKKGSATRAAMETYFTRKNVTSSKVLHNKVNRRDKFAYDIYQTIPAESAVNYYKTFTFLDNTPEGIKVEGVKVFEGDKDITSSFKSTVSNSGTEDLPKYSVSLEYTGNLGDASFYNKTYRFHMDVTAVEDFDGAKSYVNSARVGISYRDYTYTSLADGKTVTLPTDNAPVTLTTNDVQTDVQPIFCADDWETKKEILNAKGEDIHTQPFMPGDIVTYRISIINKLAKTSGVATVRDELPAGVTFVDAANGGVFKDGFVTFTNVAVPAKSTVQVTFRVKVNNIKAVSNIDNMAEVELKAKTGNADEKYTNETHNFVPDIVKIVTDKDGNNINAAVVNDGDTLYYHIFVKNTDVLPEKKLATKAIKAVRITGVHRFTTYDEVPENASFISAAPAGMTAESMPAPSVAKLPMDAANTASAEHTELNWTEEFQPGEVREYVFVVKAEGKGVTIRNTATATTADQPAAGEQKPRELVSNEVINYTPEDPVKSVRNQKGEDIHRQFLQVGEAYYYSITVQNPSDYQKVFRISDPLPENITVTAIDDGTVVDSMKAVVVPKAFPVKGLADSEAKATAPGTHSLVGREVTWVSTLEPHTYKAFTFVFVPAAKNDHIVNGAHTHVTQKPIDPVTKKEDPSGPDVEYDRDTNEVENWTPADPVKSVVRVNGETETPQDMDLALVWGLNGDTLEYRIDVANNSTQKKVFTLTDVLSDEVTFLSASDGGKYTDANRTLVWTLDMEPESERFVTFQVKVNEEDRIGSADNNVVLAVDQSHPTSNTTDTDINIKPVKHVYDKDGKDIDQLFVNYGDELTYVITVHNPDELTKRFTVTDIVPENMKFVSAKEAYPHVNRSENDQAIQLEGMKANAGSNRAYSVPEEESPETPIGELNIVSSAEDGSSVKWVADIPAGATYDFEFTVVTTEKNAYIWNEATVRVNRSSIKTNIVENWTPADPVKTVTRTYEDGEPQDMDLALVWGLNADTLVYRIDVANNSKLEKTFTITDTLDEDLAFVSTSDNGAYDEAARNIKWVLKMAPGEKKFVTFTAQGDGMDKVASADNQAHLVVDEATPDSNPTDTDIDTKPTKAVYDKDGNMINGTIVNYEEELTYVITVHNPDELTKRFTVTDIVPENTRFASAIEAYPHLDSRKGEEPVVDETKDVEAEGTKTQSDEAENTGSGEAQDEAGSDAQPENAEHDSNERAYSVQEEMYPEVALGELNVVTPAEDGSQVVWIADIPAGEAYDFEFRVITTEKDAYIWNEATVRVDRSSIKTNIVENWTPMDPVKSVLTLDGMDVHQHLLQVGDTYKYTIRVKNPSDFDKIFTITDPVYEHLTVDEIDDGVTISEEMTEEEQSVLKEKAADDAPDAIADEGKSDENEADPNSSENQEGGEAQQGEQGEGTEGEAEGGSETQNADNAGSEAQNADIELVPGTHKYVDHVITWMTAMRPHEEKVFTFTFVPEEKGDHWYNKARVLITQKPIDPFTNETIPERPDVPREQETNETENWTPDDPVKTVTRTYDGGEQQDMDRALVWGLNVDVLVYRIDVTNNTTLDKVFTLTDIVDDEITFISASDDGRYDGESRTITWKLDMAPESSRFVTFSVKVNKKNEIGSAENNVLLRVDEAYPTSNTTDTDINIKPVKAVYDTGWNNVNGAIVNYEEELTYVITVHNPDELTKRFTVTDMVPTNTRYVSSVEAYPHVERHGDGTRPDVKPAASEHTDSKPAEGSGSGDVTVMSGFRAGESNGVYSEPEEQSPETPLGELNKVSVSEDQTKVTWVADIPAGETYDFEFHVVTTEKNSDIENKATVRVDRSSIETNTVQNWTEAPVKTVETLDGKDQHQMLLQVGDTYRYTILIRNPSDYTKLFTVTDKVYENLKVVDINEDGKFSDDTRVLTWVRTMEPHTEKLLTFTFIPNEKMDHWFNHAHEVITQQPIDPITRKEIPDDPDVRREQDTNETENWTPEDPVKTVRRAPAETNVQTGDKDMDLAVVWSENADTLCYTISFRNNTSLKKIFTIKDILDEDLEVLSASDEAKYNKSTRTITWEMELGAGAEKTVSFKAKVASGNTVTSVNNTATLYVDTAYPHSNDTDTDVDTTPTKKVTDSQGKDIDQYLVNKDDELTYTITVHNPDEFTKQFKVEDVVPENTELVNAFKGVRKGAKSGAGDSSESVSAGGAVNTVTPASDKKSVTWVADIPAGATYDFVFVVKAMVKDSYIPNKAKVYVDDSFIETNIVENWVPDDPMKAVVNGDKDVNGKVFFREDQNTLTYKITVKNPANSEKVFTVTDNLDENLQFVSADNGGKASGQTVTWSVKVPAKGELVVSVDARIVEKPTREKIPNKALAVSDNFSYETNTVVNYVTDMPKKHVMIGTTDIEGKMIFAENDYTYTITWKNPTEKAVTYTVTDTLQDGIQFVRADNGGKANGQKVTWENIQVEAGKEMTVSMLVKASKALEGKAVDNIGHVEQPDDPEFYKHDTNKVTVYVSKVEKAVVNEKNENWDGKTIVPGDTLVYQIKVANPSETEQTATISDTIPQGVSFVSATDGGTQQNRMIVFQGLKVPAGGKTVSITVKSEEASENAELKNIAEAETPEGHKTPSNEVVNYALSAPVKTVMAGGSNADNVHVAAGTDLTYSIKVKNPSKDAQKFTVTDTVDQKLQIAQVMDGGQQNGNVITWEVTIPGNAEKSVSFLAKALSENASVSVENIAKVKAGGSSERETNKVITYVDPKPAETPKQQTPQTQQPAQTPVVQQPVPVQTPVQQPVPEQTVINRGTGDDSHMMLWIGTISAVLIGMAGALVLRKRSKAGR